jgi:imidazolonepropionase-like amidohydrolase
MRRVLALLCLTIFAFCCVGSACAADPPAKALRFGKLVDGKGKVWTDAIVIVRGERIVDVTTDASKIPAGTEVLDLRRYTAIPGLIDVHTHITYYWDQSSNVLPFDQQGSSRLPAVTVFLAQ